MKKNLTLSYIQIEASNLLSWKEFADRLGFQTIQVNENELNLRMDEHLYRIIITQGPLDDLTCVGWEFESEQALSQHIAHLATNGILAKKMDAEAAAQRQVSTLYCLTDLNNVKHELVTGVKKANQPFESKVLNSEFFTRPGLGHVVITTQDKEGSTEFYQKFGLAISDTITQEVAPGFTVEAVFMHSNERHHSLAFLPLPPGGKRLNHFMVEVTAMDDVGLAFDRCQEAKDPIVMTLGRHPNDEMFSFYVASPSGIAVEFEHDGKLIDYENWQIGNYPKLSTWGHKFNPA